MRAALVVALALVACKDRPTRGVPVEPARDAAPADAAIVDAGGWPQLAELPHTDADRVIALPARPDVPRFDVGGPAIVGDVAIVASSQLGFAAVDWRRGQLVWTKPAGLHVAPPLARGGDAILIADCASPPDVADTLLGCLRVVTAAGVDQTYTAIHGAKLDAFAAARGPQQLWLDGERVRWRRGDAAVTVDLITGVARPAAIDPPPLRVAYRDHAWDITQVDGRIVARERGKLAWQTQRPYGTLLGAVYLAELAPMVRALNPGRRAEMNLFDIDATGSLHGQVAFPVPGIGVLGHAIDPVGNTAIAIRMDTSLRHDFVVGFAATALLLYVYPLPEVDRDDPVGVAIAPDGVLVFHDGDSLTVLPELSAPPTAPGAPKAPSQNPTP